MRPIPDILEHKAFIETNKAKKAEELRKKTAARCHRKERRINRSKYPTDNREMDLGLEAITIIANKRDHYTAQRDICKKQSKLYSVSALVLRKTIPRR